MTLKNSPVADFDFVELFGDDLGAGFLFEPFFKPERAQVSSDGVWLEFGYQQSGPDLLSSSCLAPPPRKMLLQFIELARGEPGRLRGDATKALAFARCFGSLGLCAEHGRSCWHKVPPCSQWTKRLDGLTWVREKLSVWYAYSRLARAILNLLANPQASERHADLAWLQRAYRRPTSDPIVAVNRWLGECRMHLMLINTPPRLRLLPLPTGFAQIGFQLAATVAGRRVVALCAGCSRFFEVKRQPRRDRACYCQKCGRKVAQRLASQRYRERKRTQKRSANGYGTSES